MKKFFTVLSLQSGNKYIYKSKGNDKLQYDKEISYPILTAINGYAEKGEEIRVIAVVTDVDKAKENIAIFTEQLMELRDEKGFVLEKGLELVYINDDDSVFNQVDIFQKLIEFVDDNDVLFGCMTYGTKPTSTALLMAIQYAYRITKNSIIECIVYGKINRVNDDKTSWHGEVYDMTGLVQLDEIVHTLAKLKVKNPKETIKNMLQM